jgi:HSP20 family molecular chaperone IbpA
MKRYVNQYRNQRWLYTVSCSVDSDDYILVAVVPGVGWYDIAMRLTRDEVEILRRSEDEFTDLVNQFLHGRDLPKYKTRRIEMSIRNLGTDEIGVVDEG